MTEAATDPAARAADNAAAAAFIARWQGVAASELGLSRVGLRNKLVRYGLEPKA